METKICGTCSQEKSLECFYLYKHGTPRKHCKECLSKKHKEQYVWKNPRNTLDGHLICSKCSLEKPILHFKPRKNTSLGYHRRCIDCIRLHDKEYAQKNKDKINRRSRQARLNPDRAKIMRLRANEYRKNNIDKIRKYYKSEKYKKYRKEYEKKRELNNPSVFIKKRLRRRFNEVVNNKYKHQSILNLLGCSVEDFKKYLESKFDDGMSWENYGKRSGCIYNSWQIDHIIPCASFDLTKFEEQKRCFHYTNMQPLWAIDNMKKGSRITVNE